MRNVENQANIGRATIAEREDITVGEMQQLYNMFKAAPTEDSGLFEIIGKAFYMGYAVGQRGAIKNVCKKM